MDTPAPSTSSASTTMTPAFTGYRQTLDDAALMSRHAKLGEKVLVPVGPSSSTGMRSGDAGFSALRVFEETIFACVEEWYRLPATYHLPAHQRLDEAVTTPGEEPVPRALAIQAYEGR